VRRDRGRASSHPGKFGFAAFHNLLRFGFRGAVYP